MDNWDDIQEIWKSSGPDVKQYESGKSYSDKMGKQGQNGTLFKILLFTNLYDQNVVLCRRPTDRVPLKAKYITN